MIKGNVKIREIDHGFNDFKRSMREVGAEEVAVGLHAGEEQTLLIIGASNEFGATIHHPGGTSYGYKTPQDAKKGKVQFLKGGTGHKVLGVTKPHTITIPARPYIRSTVDENQEKYGRLIEQLFTRVVDGTLDVFGALELLGMRVESDIKRKMTTLKSPANKPSTIRKKGSENPLINTGHLRASIRYVVR